MHKLASFQHLVPKVVSLPDSLVERSYIGYVHACIYSYTVDLLTKDPPIKGHMYSM